MAPNRRAILTTGTVLVVGGIAGCSSIVSKSSSQELSYIKVNNKSPTAQTIELAATAKETSTKWTDTFTIEAGETRNAEQKGSKDHTVPGQETYQIRIQVKDDKPTASSSVIPWQDATGTFVIDIFKDRINTRIDEDG